MVNALKSIIVFVVFTTGCTVITEASLLRCYYKSIDDYVEYESEDIEKMMNSPPYFTKDIATLLWIHGFNGTMTGPATTTMVTGGLGMGDRNVCSWNWDKEARASPLFGSIFSYTLDFLATVKIVAQEMANAFIKVANKGLNLPALQAFAHSIGAHLAGYCGRKLKESGLEIGRIYGLDNAGPLYEFLKDPLNKDDAAYVSCLHCDPGKKGINSSHCHTDIWVNYYYFEGPKSQPGCDPASPTNISEAGRCSHDYCWKLINSSFMNDFPISYAKDYWTWARLNGTAEPKTQLGEKIDKSIRGNLFFSALGKYPYTLGPDGLRPNY